jgi:hypothetical protein
MLSSPDNPPSHINAGIEVSFNCIRLGKWPPSAQDSADLLDVIGIVAHHMNRQIPDGDAATLGMNPGTFPLLRS